jgi:hypothetical protein
MTQNLDQTTQAMLAADAAHRTQAIESVKWERRGLLQRLVRAGSISETDPEGRQRGK